MFTPYNKQSVVLVRWRGGHQYGRPNKQNTGRLYIVVSWGLSIGTLGVATLNLGEAKQSYDRWHEATGGSRTLRPRRH